MIFLFHKIFRAQAFFQLMATSRVWLLSLVV